jgi:hypothetical protein
MQNSKIKMLNFISSPKSGIEERHVSLITHGIGKKVL